MVGRARCPAFPPLFLPGRVARWAAPLPRRPRPPVSLSAPLSAFGLGLFGSVFSLLFFVLFSGLERLFWGLGRLFWWLGGLGLAFFLRIFVVFFGPVLCLLPFRHRLPLSCGLSAGRGSSVGLPSAFPAFPSLAPFARRSGWPRRVRASRPGSAAILVVPGRWAGRWLAPVLLPWACLLAPVVLPVVAFSFGCFRNFF